MVRPCSCSGAAGQFLTVQHSSDYITICEFEAMGMEIDAPPPPNLALGQPRMMTRRRWRWM